MSAVSNNQMLDEAESKVPNREEIAKYYLKKHRITDLFDNITAALVYERPGNISISLFTIIAYEWSQAILIILINYNHG